MNIGAGVLPEAWYRVADALVIAVALWVLRAAPWHRLRDNTQSHAFLGACALVFLLWTVRPPGLRGVEFHLSGATAMTLMFGPPLALAGVAIVLLGLALATASGLAAYSADFVVLGVLPIAASWGILVLAERLLPPNLFVYIFGPAFLGAAVAMASSTCAGVGLVAAFADPDRAAMALEFLPYGYLLSFAEATLTGMVITLMVVYRPAWVGTFDDRRYLRKR